VTLSALDGGAVKRPPALESHDAFEPYRRANLNRYTGVTLKNMRVRRLLPGASSRIQTIRTIPASL